MELDNQRLLTFITTIGLLVTIVTTLTLPSLDWGEEKKVDPVAKKEVFLEYKIPKRLSSTN
ncbi:MAG: hypothetical protein CME70_20360 [Halobacteriovorax sp.]|nr:hypothetical protein [Halobacteriovorax sp.]|tara:strand:- start:58486 stop:58668 length:183 start_codon:yes stop_codon:yes gene_type:complete